jgi:hypothetical protein
MDIFNEDLDLLLEDVDTDTEDDTNEEDNEDFYDESNDSFEGDEVLTEAAKSLGLFNEEDESILSEYYQTSIVKIDKKTKIERLTKQAAIMIARENNDPMYVKLAKLNQARKFIKEKLAAKYASQAKGRVKKILQDKKSGNAKLGIGKDQPPTKPNK